MSVGRLLAALLALASAARAAEAPPAFLDPSLEARDYYQHKHGFKDIVEAKNHAYKEFLHLVRQRRIDPAHREFFSYFYTVLHPASRQVVYFHSEWEPAVAMGIADGNEMYAVRSPIAESATIRKRSMIHSHPTDRGDGEGPSRMDVVLAASYRRSNGQFRYLYLVNNRLKLIQYKALRAIDGSDRAALLAVPAKPLKGRHWQD